MPTQPNIPTTRTKLGSFLRKVVRMQMANTPMAGNGITLTQTNFGTTIGLTENDAGTGVINRGEYNESSSYMPNEQVKVSSAKTVGSSTIPAGTYLCRELVPPVYNATELADMAASDYSDFYYYRTGGTDYFPQSTDTAYWQVLTAAAGGMNYKGDYDVAVGYAVNDCVTYNQGFYICIRSGTGQSPELGVYWVLLSTRGLMAT